MQKELGIAIGFMAKDQGLKATFRSLQTDVNSLQKRMEDSGKNKFFSTKINQFSKYAQGSLERVQKFIKGASKVMQGEGVTKEFIEIESLQKRMALRIGDSVKATKILNQNMKMLTVDTGIVWDDAANIVSAFEKNGLASERFEKSMRKTGQLVRAFKIDAGTFAEQFALANKNLNISEDSLMSFIDKLVYAEGKSGLSGIVAAFPNMIDQVQDAVGKGIIKPEQAKGFLAGVGDVTAMLRAGGLTIGESTGLVGDMISNVDRVRGALAEIRLGMSGTLGETSKSFALMRTSFAEMQGAYSKGDLTAVMDKMVEVGGRMATEGDEAYMAFAKLVKLNLGENMFKVLNAARTTGFKNMKKTMADTRKMMGNKELSKDAEITMNKLMDTVDNRQKRLEGIHTTYQKLVSDNVEKMQKKILDAEISVKEERVKAASGDPTASMWAKALRYVEEYKQGGIFAISGLSKKISDFTGISESSLLGVYAGFKELSPIIDDVGGVMSGALSTAAQMATLYDVLVIKAGLFGGVGKLLKTTMTGLFGATGLFGKALGGLSFIMGVTKTFAVGMWTALTGPIGLIVVGIGLIAAAFVVLYKKCKPFRDVMDALWDGIVSGVKMAWDKVSSFAGKIVQKIKEIIPAWLLNLIKKGGSLVSSISGAVKSSLTSSTSSDQAPTDKVIESPGNNRTNMKEFANVVMRKETYTLKDLALVLTQGFSMVVDAINEQEGGGEISVSLDNNGLLKYMNRTASANLQNAGISG